MNFRSTQCDYQEVISKSKIYFPNRNTKKLKNSSRFFQSGSYTQGNRLLPKFNGNKYELLFL